MQVYFPASIYLEECEATEGASCTVRERFPKFALKNVFGRQKEKYCLCILQLFNAPQWKMYWMDIAFFNFWNKSMKYSAFSENEFQKLKALMKYAAHGLHMFNKIWAFPLYIST